MNETYLKIYKVQNVQKVTRQRKVKKHQKMNDENQI